MEIAINILFLRFYIYAEAWRVTAGVSLIFPAGGVMGSGCHDAPAALKKERSEG